MEGSLIQILRAQWKKRKKKGIFNMNKIAKEVIDSKIKVDNFIHSQENLSLLRFITCGSVDDGKSTLIGRILFESQALFDDQIKTLQSDSKQYGTQGSDIDYALLVDGLSAEREQGITIDVAYRFFSTSNRKFIVADTPGHEQYTRNMITGASTADVAVILIDARKGVLEQTKRHSFLTSLVGIKNIILAVNKMDLINYDKHQYEKIVNDYKVFAGKLNFNQIYDIPVSALKGCNILDSSQKLNWFKGPSLIALLETINVENLDNDFVMPIQNVLRPNSDFRAFCGMVSSGSISVGDRVRSMLSGKSAIIKTISIGNNELLRAVCNQSISLTLDTEIDISRGDVLCSNDAPIEVSNVFNVNLSWLSDTESFKGRSYIAKIGNQKISCQLTDIKYKFDVNTLEQKPSKSLVLNDICNAVITLSREVPFTIFQENQSLGKFILIDPLSNQTLGAAMIKHSMRRASNIHKHNLEINRQIRENFNGSKSKLLWLTGISGSGKSTIANELEKKLFSLGIRTYILDGDNVRHGLNNDLGFSDADRVENIRRVGEVAKLMLDAGLLVISSFISPFATERNMVRSLVKKDDFIEIFVDTPLEVAERRDPKGLYKKARTGEIPNFTGISSGYEKPLNPEIILKTKNSSVEDCVTTILDYLDL
ncbi:adenylyl-sulfate kinase [Gammaproteobacteria bacterium]|nr:adenylyl-sulfate kinase [Gammaproteobacteria bacterium]